jgi:hypothetical protein
MKEIIRWIFKNWVATIDERYDLLIGAYNRAHRDLARLENYVGHTSRCCGRDYPSQNSI